MTATGDAMRWRRVAVLVALVALAVSPAGSAPQITSATRTAQMTGVTCFLKGEEVSGFNKICYYDCLGSRTAITIGSVQLCPLTIQR